VVTELTRQVSGLLKAVVVLTSFRAQTPLDGADTAIWLVASPEVDGITGTFWNKRREAENGGPSRSAATAPCWIGGARA
jgi:hypothetical protein